MFEANSVPTVDFKAFMKERYSVEVPHWASITVVATDWVDEPEKADWEYPSVVVYRHCHKAFADTIAFAEHMQEICPLPMHGVNRDVNPWYNYANFAANSALEWDRQRERNS